MKRFAVPVFLAASLYAAGASAGPATETLTQCLLKAASPQDREVMVQWIFVFQSLHPAVAPIAAIPVEQRNAINQKMAQVYERLIFDSCYGQTVTAMKSDGAGAVDASLQELGRQASLTLMQGPGGSPGMQGMAAYMHMDKWMQLGMDSAPGAAAPKPAVP